MQLLSCIIGIARRSVCPLQHSTGSQLDGCKLRYFGKAAGANAGRHTTPANNIIWISHRMRCMMLAQRNLAVEMRTPVLHSGWHSAFA
jgi:hypothetical protein